MDKNQCICASNKIKPNETCLFCCHKHLAAALALTNEELLNDELLLRIASQIQLAAWHFDKNYIEYVKECKNIINKILTFNLFKEDLITLVEESWELYLNKKGVKHSYFNTNINSIENIDQNYLDGMLCVSNAIELYKYEEHYKNVNLSYVIGQLTLASWHFQKNYKNYSLKLRIIYNKINTNTFNINELEEFKIYLWKKYKQNFSYKKISYIRENF